MPATAPMSIASSATSIAFAEEEQGRGSNSGGENWERSESDRPAAAWRASAVPPSANPFSRFEALATAPRADHTSHAHYPPSSPPASSATSSRGFSAGSSTSSEVDHAHRSPPHRHPSARATSPSLAPPSFSSAAQARVAAVLRHGSPRTRGVHSINPMAPDAARAPPVEVQGPPRYLRARGLTPSPAAVAARSRRTSPEQRHRSRRSPNSRKHSEARQGSRGDPRRKSVHDGKTRKSHTDPAVPTRQSHDAVDLLWAEQYPDATRPAHPRRQTSPPYIPSPAHLYDGQDEDDPRNTAGNAVRVGRGWTQRAPPSSAAPPSRHPRSPGSRRTSAVMDPSQGPDAMQLRVPQLSSHGGPSRASAAAPPPSLWTQSQWKQTTSPHAQPPPSPPPPPQQVAAWGHPAHSTSGVASPRFAVPAPAASGPTPTSAPAPAAAATAASASPAMPSTSPIARTYVAQSFSSDLPGASTVLLGPHHRGAAFTGTATASAGAVSASPRALHAAPHRAMADIEVAMVAGALAELPAPPVLERLEDMLRCWHAGQLAHHTSTSAAGAAADGRLSEPRCRYTDAEVAATFDLVLHLCVRTAPPAEAVTVQDVKDEVARRTGVPAAQLCVVYDGMSLQDCLPVHLLMLAADGDDDEENTNGGGGVEDLGTCAAGAAGRGRGCLRLVCVSLQSPSPSAAAVRRGRPLKSPLRARPPASPTPEAEPGVSDARTSTTTTTTTDARRSLMLLSPAPRAGAAAPSSSAAVAPAQRPGAVPFLLSTGDSAAAAAASLPPTHDTEQRVRDHIRRLRSRYLASPQPPATTAASGRAPSDDDSLRAASRLPPPPPSTSSAAAQQQHDVLLSALTSAASVTARDIARGDDPPHRQDLLRGRSVLSDALIAALPAPPVRRATPTAPPRPATASGVHAAAIATRAAPPAPAVSAIHLPVGPSWTVGRSLRDADGLDSIRGGGVDASWIEPLSASSTSLDPPAAAVLRSV